MNIEEIKVAEIKIEEVKNENLEIHWKVMIDSKDVLAKYNEELASVATKISMPGFRPGKVPSHLVETRYGKTIYEEISNKLIEENIEKLLKDKDIQPVSQPKLEDLTNIMGSNIEFTLKIEHLPQISIPDFKNIKLEKPILEINDKDIDKELKEIAEAHTLYKEKKGKAVNKDKVIIDFLGKIDGAEFEGGASKNFSLILGSKSMIPGFEDQILEHKAGDEFTIKVKFPDDYHAKNLAGKDTEFDIKLHEVQKPSLPEINDEFIKETLGFKDFEELKRDIRGKIGENYNEQIGLILKMRLFDDLEDLLKFDIPSTLFQNEYNSIKSQTESDKDFAQDFEGKTQEEIEKYYKKIANRRVKIALLISEYSKLHNISISQEEIRDEILKRALTMVGYEREFVNFYTKYPRAAQELAGSLLEDKVVRTLIDKEITLSEKNISKDQLDKLIDKENNKKAIS